MTAPLLVDSHCHLDFPDFAEERQAVIDRAHAAGVGTMLTICTHVTRFPQVAAVAESDPDIWCSVGIHPHEAGSEPDTSADRLVELARNPKVAAIGECGLDYFYDHSPRERQAEVFRTHAAAARETGLPIVVHTRDADEDTRTILGEESRGGRLTGVLHCFSSGADLAWAGIELGFYVSFSGIVTFKKSEALQKLAADLPLERLLVETDAPYLAPVPKRGKRNEPAFVAHTAGLIAGLRGMDPAEFAASTTANFHRLFSRTTPAGMR